MEKLDIKSLTLEELTEAIRQMGDKPFRAKQIYQWLHQKLVTDFDEMSNLSKELRARLAENFILTVPEVARKQVSRVDGTVKYLWRMRDGDCVESVLMHYEHGVSVCVSTQVGCRMGCKFCASGLNGKKRNLSAGEILDEILFMQKDSGEKVSNIVLMGTGEPLDNYDNVLKFLHLVSCPEGINIGQRHISLSTSGIADKIETLAKEKLQITLSVSLHAPDDETRSSIMPVNDAYPVERLMQACRYYFDTTGRRISYEHMMARDKTDRPWQAEKLAKLLRGRPGHVNLIPLNEVEESPLSPSKPETVRRFQQALEKRGVTVKGLFDVSPEVVGTVYDKFTVRHIDEIHDFCRTNGVDIAILTLPKTAWPKALPNRACVAFGIFPTPSCALKTIRMSSSKTSTWAIRSWPCATA